MSKSWSWSRSWISKSWIQVCSFLWYFKRNRSPFIFRYFSVDQRRTYAAWRHGNSCLLCLIVGLPDKQVNMGPGTHVVITWRMWGIVDWHFPCGYLMGFTAHNYGRSIGPLWAEVYKRAHMEHKWVKYGLKYMVPGYISVPCGSHMGALWVS